MKIILLCLFVILFTGCEKKNTPEAVLESYVSQFLLNDLSRAEAIEYLGKDYKASIEKMDESEYAEYIIKNKFQKRSFRVLIKNCSDETCDLTYVVKYRQKTLNSGQFNIDVKKIARLEKIDDSWKIVDVENVKTYIESKDPIESSY